MARPTLRKGMVGKKGTEIGEAIRIWRTLMGLTPAAGVTSYDFGPATVNATMAWQGSHGLADPKRKDGLGDGIVGPKSWAKYDSLQYGPPPPPPPTPHPAAQQAAEVIKAQSSAKKPPPKPSVAPAAHVAAATIAQRTTPVVSSAVRSFQQAVQSVKLPTSVKLAQSQVTETVRSAPLWLKIVGGAVSSLLVYTGLKKVVS
jgi:peptidoglycan hydrolase-like protein with peptidoglycan-binding domain